MSHDLTLQIWFSPLFPLGGFACSHGLESAITDGRIGDWRALTDWLSLLISAGSLGNDLVLAAAARRGEPVADLARALAGSRERLEETEAQGGAMARVLNEVQGGALASAPLPVVAGRAARAEGIPLDAFLRACALAAISNLVGVAMRLVPLSQTDGQRALAALKAPVAAAARAAAGGLDDLGSPALAADIGAMTHETLEVRIFRT